MHKSSDAVAQKKSIGEVAQCFPKGHCTSMFVGSCDKQRETQFKLNNPFVFLFGLNVLSLDTALTSFTNSFQKFSLRLLAGIKILKK